VAEATWLIQGPVAALRAHWHGIGASAALAAPELEDYLDRRLLELVERGELDEGNLIDVVDDVSDHLAAVDVPDLAPEVGRRLMRSIYEFFLALDAAAEAPVVEADLVVTTQTITVAGVVSAPSAPVDAERLVGPPAAAQVEALIAGQRHTEAGALLLERAYRDPFPGIDVVAVDSGDLCRAAGDLRAAADCYLAAAKADPTDELPLWRLAELSLERSEPQLAVSYLERIVAVARSRGDLRVAAQVYRKMTAIAPDREDLRASLTHIEATGRLD
jgi:tetratricopeptide (TPR) repeat protein